MAIVLSVVFQAAPTREQELHDQLLALVGPTRTEPGCLEYQLSKSDEKPGTFLFYEKFADQAALDEHLAKDYFQAFVKYREAGDPVARVDVMRWTSVV